jgi:MFS family permease
MADKSKSSVRRLARYTKQQPFATVAALMVGGFFIGASQNLMAPNLSSIASAFGLTPSEKDVILGGWMSTAFFIVGAPMSIVFGILADRAVRVQLFLLMCAAAAAINFGTAFAFSIYQLLVLRACLGAVYGALNPVLFSMVGDMFSPSSRASIASYFSLAVGGGTAIGQMFAGVLSKLGWRFPYIVVASGSVLSCFVLLAIALEPIRGGADNASASSSSAVGASSGTLGGSSSSSASGLLTPGPSQGEQGSTSSSLIGSAIKHRHHTAAGGEGGSEGSASSSSGTGAMSVASTAARVRRNVSPNTMENGGVSSLAAPASSAAAVSEGPASGDTSSSSTGSISSSSSSSSSASSEKLSAREFARLLLVSLSQLRGQLQRILAVPSNVLVFSQALFGTIPWAVITVFLPDFLHQEQGFTVPGATLLVLLFGIGAVVGGVAGGIIGSSLYKRDPALMPLVFGITQAASALPMLYLVNAELLVAGGNGGVKLIVYPTAILAGLFASLTGPNLKAILMNANVPSIRGAVFTFAYLFDSISKGLAPVIISLSVAAVGSRPLVFSVALLGWVASGAIIANISRTIKKDEANATSGAAAKAGSSAGGSGGGSSEAAAIAATSQSGNDASQ